MNTFGAFIIRDLVRIALGIITFDLLLIYTLFRRDPSRKRQGKI